MLSSFANSLDILYVTNGVMFGAGAALVYSPSLVILGHYFKKRLGIVNGIVSSGSSLFTIVSPLLLNELLSKFGLSITYRILAALMFPVMLCTLVFKPLVLVPRQTNPDSTENDGKRVCCSKNGWRKVINISIWKNKKYLVWAIAFPASLFGYFVPLTHLVGNLSLMLYTIHLIM